MSAPENIREAVRQRYAEAATRSAPGDHERARAGETSCCAPAPVATTDEGGRVVFGAELYGPGAAAGAPAAAVAASLGCGIPTAVADLHPGEVVLDLGSGAGADVLISARRVAPGGRVIGLDMTDEMLDLARLNAAEAGVDNVEFLKGYLEDIPLPDRSVDVVISNCVLNLAADKLVVLAEAARVLRPGGRLAISDVIADEDMDANTRADMAAWTGCIAGALTQTEFTQALTAAGFSDIEVRPTHRVHAHAQAAIIRAALGPAETKGNPMSVIEVFEPALCCATGVCGEDVDQGLVTFSADMDFVCSLGGNVRRYNLASEPLAFAESEPVKGFLKLVGSRGLPLILVDGVTAMTGGYPDRALLATWAGVAAPAEAGTAPGLAPGLAPGTAPGTAGAIVLDITEATPASGGCCSTPSDETSAACCSSSTADTSSGCCSSSTAGTAGCC